MSHINTSHDRENEYPEDRPMSLSEAVDVMYDPYYEIAKENVEAVISRQQYAN